ncbi:MAG: hypothetical protein COA79_16180 [Planctomycetota bacterium]|nr:MAG: hypothetical protein COA79_16180 [Planctomycetota bacterium]
MKTRYAIGCMSGTSLDGLDISYIKVLGEGLEIQVELIDSCSVSISEITEFFKICIDENAVELSSILKAANDFGQLHAKSIKEFIKDRPVDLICVHGQTLYHKPPLSCQLINPFVIAKEINCPVVYDLRGMDLACGGEGAPLTPMSDLIMYKQKMDTVIINLGGFSNFTYLPKDLDINKIEGGDICVCNQLLDALYKNNFDAPYDIGGKEALLGNVNEKLFSEITLQLNKQAKSKRSLGSNDELKNLLIVTTEYTIQDQLRTFCEAIAYVICQNIPTNAEHLIVAGGGACNQALLKALKLFFKGTVVLSDDYGIPVQERESMGFAVLGVLCQDRIPITLSKITNKSSHLVSGAWILP